MDILEGAGYDQYEISNYARPGRECRHNLAYWFGADYLGLGPSAFSTIGTRRWQNIADTAQYSERILTGESAIDFTEEINAATRRAETIAFGLRTSTGVPMDLLGDSLDAVREYLGEGFFEPHAGCVRLTRKGKLVADSLAVAFV